MAYQVEKHHHRYSLIPQQRDDHMCVEFGKGSSALGYSRICPECLGHLLGTSDVVGCVGSRVHPESIQGSVPAQTTQTFHMLGISEIVELVWGG